MPTLSDLLSDPDSQIELIAKGQYLDENDDLQTEWVSQSGWDDQIDGPFGSHIPPLLTTNLSINQQIDPLDIRFDLLSLGSIELANNHLDFAGRYDNWRQYSVDGQSWTIYAVGTLSTGVRVELADVEDSPLFELEGINIPEVSSDQCLIRCKSARSLDSALQPVTYSPPALYFPGILTAIVNLGNNLNITGDQSISVWIYLEDPATTTQYIEFKDSGAAGHYIAIGLVGAGTIAGGVEILVRGQSPTTSTTAANVLQAYRWHRIDVSIAATTRRIDIDGTTAITTTSITGTPAASAVDLEIGRSFKGRIHRLLHWTDARSNATMSAEGRTPIAGNETNLREAFLFGEGKGDQVASSKIGSVITGTIAAGVLWDTASWHYESILGQYEPYVLGTVPRVPVTWIDPPKQIGQISRGAIALLSEIQSNHSIVSPANYTIGYGTGTIQVVVGALSGTYSATVTANNFWNSALLFNGTSSRATAVSTMPAGSKYIGAHFRVDTTVNAFRQILGWNGAASVIIMRLFSNTLSVNLINDAGTLFTASMPVLVRPGKRYSAIASLDTANPSTGLNLFVDGILVATTAVSGAFTGTQPTLAVGHRSTLVDFWFPGVIDEIIVGNTACTLSMAEQYHSYPCTPSFPGIVAGWHLDEAAGSSAAPFVGAASLTLTSIAWAPGRSALTDLARAVLYSSGYAENDLDSTTWLAALLANNADCGWYVNGGAKSIDVLNVILGGLGFIVFNSEGLLKIKRFEGVSGTPDIELDPIIDLQSQPVEGNAADPAIYQWTVDFATNNSKQDQANIAGGLATTDPDRYQYGAKSHRSAIKSDGSILERFPNAIPMTRTTALLNLKDAETEAARLLAIHRHGADRKSVQAFLGIAQIEILDELGPLMEETDLDAGNTIVTGLTIDEGLAIITIWRPAMS